MTSTLTAEELAQRMADGVEHHFYPSLGECQAEASGELREYARLLIQMREALEEMVAVGTRTVSGPLPATDRQLMCAYNITDRIARAALSSADALLAKEQK